MSNPDFEQDTDLGAFALGNAPDGSLLVNLQKNEEFDPRIAADVEGLLYLGRLTMDTVIYGHSFTLQTLTRGERLAIAQYIVPWEETIGIADALQTGYLALALRAVDGQALSIPMSPDYDNPQGRLERQFPLVARWYDPLHVALYAEYSKLLVRQAQAFQELEGKSQASRLTP